jgi:hypothetical protein
VISEGGIGGTPTASGDELKSFLAFEIKPLLEASIAAIERDVITKNSEAIFFKHCRT